MKHKVIFYTLEFEIMCSDLGLKGIAEAAGMTYTSLRRKLRGESPFLLQECIDIKQALHSDLPIETLFERKEGHA